MVRKAEIKVVEGLRGGKGRLEMHHILKPEELNGHGRVYALIRMEPHSSIGFMSISVRRSRTISYPDTELLSIMMEAGFRWDRTMPALLSADRVTDLKMTQMKSW